MYRTYIIAWHTFRESVVEPIYPLLLALGTAIIGVFSQLPFFTLGSDTVMFAAVGLDIVLLFVLITTLFVASKCIYEEIEDHTMLTLMSKPLRKSQVLLGKYLGIVAAAGLGVAILGAVICLSTLWRIPGDYQLDVRSLDETVQAEITNLRWMHLAGVIPSLLLAWLEISVLAAVSVAVSTRVSLVVNLPAVIIVYIAGNLTRFLFPIFGSSSLGGDGSPGFWVGRSALVKLLAFLIGNVVPFLEVFDLRQKAIYSKIAIAGSEMARSSAVPVWDLWRYVGVAGLYGIAYASFALSVGLLLFSRRELGGGEG